MVLKFSMWAFFGLLFIHCFLVKKECSIEYEKINCSTEINIINIAELVTDSSASLIKYPWNLQESSRITCQYNPASHESQRKTIRFDRNTPGYDWYHSNLDLRFIEDDSLKKLSLDQKLKMLNLENQDRSSKTLDDIIPIRFKINTWYCLWGIPDLDGPIYFYFEDRYQPITRLQRGPW